MLVCVCVVVSLYVIVVIVFYDLYLRAAHLGGDAISPTGCQRPASSWLLAISALGRRQATQLQLLCTSKL